MQDNSRPINNSEFVVAGGDAAPLLELVETALDDVATSIITGVERGWSSTTRSAPGAVTRLVGWLGDDRGDAPSP